MKKIEIIIESVHVRVVVACLQKLQVPGYSIIRDVVGRGAHGDHDGRELSDVAHNSYVVIVCDDQQAKAIGSAMAEKTRKYGGICLISEVTRL